MTPFGVQQVLMSDSLCPRDWCGFYLGLSQNARRQPYETNQDEHPICHQIEFKQRHTGEERLTDKPGEAPGMSSSHSSAASEVPHTPGGFCEAEVGGEDQAYDPEPRGSPAPGPAGWLHQDKAKAQREQVRRGRGS